MNLLKETADVSRRLELAKTKFSGFWAVVITVVAVSMSLFHMYFNSYGEFVSIEKRAAHLAFVLFLVFMIFPARRDVVKSKPSFFDVMFAIIGSSTALYMFFIYSNFAFEGKLPDTKDLVIAITGILLLFEACRRAAGLPLVILCAAFLVYAKFGNYVPGSFKIVPFSYERIIYQMFFTEVGIFGIVLGVSATFIFMFILFGAFLGETKSSDFFNDLALSLAGHKPGGPGKVAVIASMTMGTITGSAVANVATTGSITIPLMKRVGYRPHFAGAVEAVASSGGSLMPPIMASAAFLISEILGVPYLKVITAALIPALLYYFALWVMLDLESRKTNLKGLPKEELPKLKQVLVSRGHLILPLATVIFLLVIGRTPLFAGFWGIITTIAVSSIRKDTRLNLPRLVSALRGGAIASLSPAIACATVGIIVGVATMTGFGPMMVSNIIDISAGNLLFALLLTMLASLVLGMGLPTAACYITAATIAAPALTRMGVYPMAAHLFVLYYAVLSNLTPPVALASFTASGIANSSPSRTAWTGLKLGLAGFIVPMMFVYSPGLLMDFSNMSYLKIAEMFITAIIGIVCLGVAMEKYLFARINTLLQAMFFSVSLLLIKPGYLTDLVGGIILVSAILLHMKQKRGFENTPEKDENLIVGDGSAKN